MSSTHPSRVPDRRWRPRDILLGADGLIRPLWRALTFAVLLIPLASVLQPLERAVAPSLSTNSRITFASAVLAATTLLLSWGLLAALDRRRFRALGLWFYPAWARELLVGIGVGGGLMAVVVGLQVISGGVRYHGFGPAPQAALWEAVSLAAGFLVWASLEELLFRGYAFQRLVDAFGRVAALAVFSAVFAAGHFGTPGATWLSTANTILQGLIFAVAYLKTRGLWLPIGLHFAWNYSMIAVLSFRLTPLRLQFDETLLQVELLGPDWLSGGSYGPEGSVVLTAASMALLLWMVRTRRLATSPAMSDILDKR